MDKLFIKIYDFFHHRKVVMWSLLVVSVVAMAWATSRISYEEDITSFFPEQEEDLSMIFENIPAKDRLVVMFSHPDPSATDSLIATCELFKEKLENNPMFLPNGTITVGVNESFIDSVTEFVYQYLPLFVTDSAFAQLATMTQSEALAQRMSQNFEWLISPMGGYTASYILRDPLGLSGNALQQLQEMGQNFNYTLIDGYIFSKDEQTLLCYINPTEESDISTLIDVIESTIAEVQEEHETVETSYFGAPAVAEYNARQIKKDSMFTMNLAILIVVIFMGLAFRMRYGILLLLTPVVFGGLFSLSMVYLIQGSISLIAVGSGSVILGISLSYAIHILSHANHCHDARTLLRELSAPLTIGSFTTIGAFLGLLFTNSTLLQDFGLFSSLTLVGTTLFALIFLPHFLAFQPHQKQRSVGRWIDKISKYRPDKNKPILLLIGGISLVAWLFFNDVRFDTDVMNINYTPPHLAAAEEQLNQFVDLEDGESNVVFLASSKGGNQAASGYQQLCHRLDSLQREQQLLSYAHIKMFILPDSIQQHRLERWKQFWTPEKVAQVSALINEEADRLGFEENAFEPWGEAMERHYSPITYEENTPLRHLFPEWISIQDSLITFMAQVRMKQQQKEEVYEHFNDNHHIIAADRAYFAGKLAEDVKHNFYLVLYISGFLIFITLLLSYGRIELALMAFAPMFISWIIILGIMSLLGIPFNIVTIILSTFIFGIGDDFSIFVMDGLLQQYRDRSQVLAQHKAAIFLSAFALIVGMGALVFAKHPAMHDLGVVSLIGMLVVVLVAYTVQPFLFRIFIEKPTRNGGYPFTLFDFVNTIYTFTLFLIGCIIIQFVLLVTYPLPCTRKRGKLWAHAIIRWSCAIYPKIAIGVRKIKDNSVQETFEKPAIIIANHQSFIDILMILALHKKIVMVTNGWVWRSPIFGRMVRYLDFFHTADGYENMIEALQSKVNDGYSIAIFPEGSRSANLSITRFHKGAFYLAEKLHLDIIPVLFYGNGMVSSKTQPMYIKRGNIVTKILPRITPNDTTFGIGYRERTKQIQQYYKDEYRKIYEIYNRTSNPYFKNALIKNYTYKGAVLEWYMRIKIRFEKQYQIYDQIIPRKGFIVDVGCGYGPITFMLSMLSNQRQILGIDYDAEKIAVAQHSFGSKNNNINFVHGDIRTYPMPNADVFIISDVLHYLDKTAQNNVMVQCIHALNPNGLLLIRDGDTSQTEKHKNTEKTEKWSTEIVKFNQTDGPLCFLSREQIETIAAQENMTVEVMENRSKTSNTLFILKQKDGKYDER